MGTPEKPGIYEFGEFRLDVGRQALYSISGGRWIPLTSRVFETLRFLVEHPDTLVGKTELMKAVWPHAVVEENNLDQNISALRRLLGEHRSDPRYIVTVRGRGYRFVAPVTLLTTSDGLPTPTPDRSGWTGLLARPRARWAAASAAAVILTGATLVVTWHGAEPAPVFMSPAPALAVLPFRSLSATNRNESLELGMAETLIMQLHTPELTVRPLSAVRRFADPEQDAVLAGRALGVGSVLEGHLQRDGARLRISVRLLQVEDGAQLWAERFEQDFSDIFAVQDAIAAKVRAALISDRAVEPSPSIRRYTEDADAYQHYVSGRFFRQQGDEVSLRRAQAHFQQAIDHDPRFAPAYVGLAESYSVLGVFGVLPPHSVFPPAREAVDRALELAPELGEAYASLGHIRMQYEHDWAGSEQALRRAIELNPSYAPAHQWLGLLLGVTGRFEEGLGALRTAQALESSPMYSAMVAMLLSYQRRYDDSVALLEKTLEMAPELPTAHTYLAMAHLRRGDFGKALVHLGRTSSRTPGGAAYLGQVYALSGRRAEAMAEIDRLTAESEKRYVAAYDIATIHAALGDTDQTIVWLERAIEDRSQLIGWLRWDPVFDGIRRDPRYSALVERLGFPRGSPASERY